MKISNIFKALFSAILFIGLFASCSENQNFLGEDEASLIPANASNQRSGACFITPGVVEGSSCGAPTYGFMHTLYVTGGSCTKSYDRQVTVTVFHDNNLLEQRTVTIPAHSVTSNNIGVFSNATESYGRIRLQVASVTNLSTNQADISCTWREVEPSVNNCYVSSDGDGDLDFCNGNDADGNGICDDNGDPGSDSPVFN